MCFTGAVLAGWLTVGLLPTLSGVNPVHTTLQSDEVCSPLSISGNFGFFTLCFTYTVQSNEEKQTARQIHDEFCVNNWVQYTPTLLPENVECGVRSLLCKPKTDVSICSGLTKKMILENEDRNIRENVEYGKCRLCKMRSMENVDYGKWGVWPKVQRMENEDVWKMRSILFLQ